MVPLPFGDGTVAILGLDALVVFGDLLRPGVVGAQALPNGGGGHAADGELLGAIQEIAPGDIAVDVAVEEVQQFLRVIGCFLAFHE